LKKHKNSLLEELEMEQNRTAEQKKRYDSTTSKYEMTWEHYEVYKSNKFKLQTYIDFM
jgi:hypothetical protein